MTKEKNNKKLIFGICAAVVVVMIIAIIIIIKCNNSGLNDDFFKSSGNKIVLTSPANDPQAEQMGAVRLHQVFIVDGEDIKSAKIYAEFESKEEAKGAAESDALKDSLEDGDVTEYELNDKYLILTMPKSFIDNRTTSDIKAAEEYLKNYYEGKQLVEDYTETIDYSYAENENYEYEESVEGSGEVNE